MSEEDIQYCVLQSGHCCTLCLECAYQNIEIEAEENRYGDSE